jgi:ATP-dependent helicase/nuclease subunit A
MSDAVFPLKDNQLAASNPQDNVWLSASAGTGKTQVLSARVLRLLLEPGVDPSQVLCLTFTKAGAAEMANRINGVLARWVRLEDTQLFAELGNLGADQSDEARAHARTLFASVLDCPGGGLRIDTIHAFSQWLLANFPEEADLQPGARPMEDRERELLSRNVLSDMLSEAETSGDTATTDAISAFACTKDPDALRDWLMRCASAMDLWLGNTAWQPPMRGRVNTLLGIPSGAGEEWARELLHSDTFPDAQLVHLARALREWGKPSADTAIAGIETWLKLDPQQRADNLSCLVGGILNGDSLPNGNLRHAAKFDENFKERQTEVSEALLRFYDRQTLLALADFLIPALELGRAFALRWEEAKAREGFLDFDDLIRKAAELLGNSDAAAWIRYKLDRSFDHILIDEAQDTNRAQWGIIDALIDDFFAGQGARGDKLRTIFTVGDYKQAIFGFQGTSPDNFERAKEKVKKRIDDAKANAHEIRSNHRVPSLEDLDLGLSYRTSPAVLDFVNRAIEVIGWESLGLKKKAEPHSSAFPTRAGLVTLWEPVISEADTEEDEDDNYRGDKNGDEEKDERGWLPAHDTKLADLIAQQVSRWVDPRNPNYEPFVLEKGKDARHADAGDVMVLVRKRKELASQIVAKLHAKGVAVAGVDRLRLGAPLAVKDLMAALRFAAQPLDDLSLANLLGSPLIGWSQNDLLEYCPRGYKVRLWDHLRRHEAPFVQETVAKLRDLLARADFETPQALFAWLITGPWQARRKIVARLGQEANDPIDELINAAFAYQSAHTPSLAGFIAWFDAGEGELKRDADDATGQVRVMTVHGSKGLQAPIVILADATGEPGKAGASELAEYPAGKDEQENPRMVPLPKLAKDQKAGRVAEADEQAKADEMQEHWRLLYVAMTRAEEALFIGGSLGKKQAKKGVPHEDSWYAHLEGVFDTDRLEDPLFGAKRVWGAASDKTVLIDQTASGVEPQALPAWLTTPIGPEPRPPRPLAPSGAGEEQGADPPLPPEALAIAARRGTLIHRLLERLPDLSPEERQSAGESWLSRQASDLDPAVRSEMLDSALTVLAQPEFAAIFGPDALAEVPLAATVDGVVVAGTADRLLVTDAAVTVVDFKTTRRPPASLEEIPSGTVRQMAAYCAALSAIFPGREMRAAVLYTQTPQLIEIPSATLEEHKSSLGQPQDNYAPLTLE